MSSPVKRSKRGQYPSATPYLLIRLFSIMALHGACTSVTGVRFSQEALILCHLFDSFDRLSHTNQKIKETEDFQENNDIKTVLVHSNASIIQMEDAGLLNLAISVRIRVGAPR